MNLVNIEIQLINCVALSKLHYGNSRKVLNKIVRNYLFYLLCLQRKTILMSAQEARISHNNTGRNITADPLGTFIDCVTQCVAELLERMFYIRGRDKVSQITSAASTVITSMIPNPPLYLASTSMTPLCESLSYINITS